MVRKGRGNRPLSSLISGSDSIGTRFASNDIIPFAVRVPHSRKAIKRYRVTGSKGKKKLSGMREPYTFFTIAGASLTFIKLEFRWSGDTCAYRS